MLNATDVTVIVPTRNEAANIGGFLRSIPADVAVIVVDKSTDRTPEIVRRVRARNTTLLDCAGSLTDARQLGAEHARSRWLLFTDADVAFADDYFDRLRALTRSEPPRRDSRTGATHSRIACWYGPKLSTDAYRRYYRAFAFGQRVANALRIPAASGSNMLVAAEAFAAVGGFDTRLTCNEDSELGWRLARASFGCRYAADLIVWARDHRRLHRGRWLKTTHTFLRCAVLYFDILPARWRGRDWGYWSERSS